MSRRWKATKKVNREFARTVATTEEKNVKVGGMRGGTRL